MPKPMTKREFRDQLERAFLEVHKAFYEVEYNGHDDYLTAEQVDKIKQARSLMGEIVASFSKDSSFSYAELDTARG